MQVNAAQAGLAPPSEWTAFGRWRQLPALRGRADAARRPTSANETGELMQPPVVDGAAAFGGDGLRPCSERFAHRKRPPHCRAAHNSADIRADARTPDKQLVLNGLEVILLVINVNKICLIFYILLFQCFLCVLEESRQGNQTTAFQS